MNLPTMTEAQRKREQRVSAAYALLAAEKRDANKVARDLGEHPKSELHRKRKAPR